MKKNRKPRKKTTTHLRAVGTAQTALCTMRPTQRVTSDPLAVSCPRCGAAAQRAVEEMLALEAQRAEDDAHARQEAALAANQGPRWWETPKGASRA